MSEVVIVSLISLIGTLGGSLGGILVSSKLTNWRLDKLEKQVTSADVVHENLNDRMYKVEGRVTNLENTVYKDQSK